MRVGLVGCVKSKQDRWVPAQDLYTSTLFIGRREYVERTCDQWFVLSAEHGLLRPSDVIGPYDVSLKDEPEAARQLWSYRVLHSIDQLGLDLARTTFEVHAGKQYRSSGLVAGLEQRGATVEVLAEHLSQGE